MTIIQVLLVKASLKSMKDKSSDQDKDVQEGSGLKTAGPDGEITAGSCNYLLLIVFFDPLLMV